MFFEWYILVSAWLIVCLVVSMVWKSAKYHRDIEELDSVISIYDDQEDWLRDKSEEQSKRIEFLKAKAIGLQHGADDIKRVVEENESLKKIVSEQDDEIAKLAMARCDLRSVIYGANELAQEIMPMSLVDTYDEEEVESPGLPPHEDAVIHTRSEDVPGWVTWGKSDKSGSAIGVGMQDGKIYSRNKYGEIFEVQR